MEVISVEDVPRMLGISSSTESIAFSKCCYIECRTEAMADRLVEQLDGAAKRGAAAFRGGPLHCDRYLRISQNVSYYHNLHRFDSCLFYNDFTTALENGSMDGKENEALKTLQKALKVSVGMTV
jgi:hypothetical protein